MKRLACQAAPRRTLRFCGVLLAAFALTPPLAFGGVNRWTSSGPDVAGVNRVAIDPTDPAVVYAASLRGVFKSGNGGLSWTDPSNGELDGVNVHSLAIDPVKPSSLYAGTASGILKSTDGGASWSDRLTSGAIYNLIFASQKSTIYAADFDDVGYYPAPSAVYKSTDEGETWSGSAAYFAIAPGSLVIDPTQTFTLYAAAAVTYLGVHKSVDAGSTWSLVSRDQTGVRALAIDPRNPSTLYAGTYSRGIFRSTDGGANWREFNTGLTNLGVASLAIDRTGTRLHAGTFGGGVFDYQILSGALALDLSVGTDNRARLLLTDLDNRAVFRSFDNSGNSTSGGPYGPYSGWYARAVADGSDGLTRVLWNNLDGSAALWLLGPTGNQASYVYHPTDGWTAVDVSVGSDGTTYILWTSIDGRTHLTGVAVSGALVSGATCGPYSGWTARSISNGTDGLTRVLWSNTDGRVGLSLIDAGHIVATYRFVPAPGWTARDIAVATDNQARILFVHADGRMALWSVDNSGTVTNAGTVYSPPVSGQVATRISAGADGLTRVLWTSPEATGTLWLMGLDNVRQSSFGFGPN